MSADATMPQLICNKRGDLDTLTLSGFGYQAVVTLQGAQLIYFSTDETAADTSKLAQTDNWLWVSEQAEYKFGQSIRGGVPICWPVFGQLDANPQAVRDGFSSIQDMPQHGYARTQLFELDSFGIGIDDTNSQIATLVLKLDNQSIDPCFASASNLILTVVFTFSSNGFGIKLITHNNGHNTIVFSQALHTYLPTDNIRQTIIKGFNGIEYSDTLDGWKSMTQRGDIIFDDEVDRIYHSAPDIILDTPSQTYQLRATGSQSTVVWNPWIEKSKRISQFADDDYQRMLCIETANAHLDYVTLEAGETHALTLLLQRDSCLNV